MEMPPPSVPPLPYQVPANYPPPPPPKAKFPVWAVVLIGCGGCAVLMIPILAAILFPVFSQARNKAQSVSCLSNMKQMSLGLMMYQQDYDERMPPAKRWMDASYPYIKSDNVFHCSVYSSQNRQNYGYGFNSTLSQLSSTQIAGKNLSRVSTPMLFESGKLGRNEYDPVQSVINPPRHHDGNNFAYLDGHAKYKRGTQALTGKGEADNGSYGQFSAPGNGGQ